MSKPILDMTAGSRMFWWDRHNPLAIFMDRRVEHFTVPDNSHGRSNGTREIEIAPDVKWDWAKDVLPYPDASFSLVVFDPPHLIRAGKSSWLARKYGVLTDHWQEDLKRGMDEAMRVLVPFGTVVIKWNDDQVKLSEVLKALDREPLFGDKRSKTHWLIFMKEARDDDQN